MSVNELREAAVLIREDHPACDCGLRECPTVFFEAVELLLINEANAWESQDARVSEWPDPAVNPARRRLLTEVARAYLATPETVNRQRAGEAASD